VTAPSQAPPQGDPSVAHCGRPACGAPATAVQVPTAPATSQASHCPPQAASQHTPSTQWPLAHWFAAEQVAAAGSFAVQTPPEHQLPAAQSASTAQDPAQAVPPQAYWPQVWVWTGGQAPAPAQDAASTATPPLHEAARQEVVAPG
jgi:hypothetical protein